jgi:anti-repressor protein
MNNLRIFEKKEFGQLRVIGIDSEPWFAGKDVAEALGYADTNKAIAMHVESEDKLNDKTALSLGQRGGWFINESGIYSLILSSKLPTAKKFKRWVTYEVLPSIRKTGGYIAGQEELSDEELIAKALEVAHRKIEEKEKQINEMKPKALFADAVSASDRSILIGEMAKILRQNGIENMGQNRLFEWMRDNGFLIKGNRSDRNMPTQRAMEMGLFEIKETTIVHSDGHTTINKTPKVTGKGQAYFVNRFLDRVETYGD